MKSRLIAFVFLIGMATSAAAQPAKLAHSQLDVVTAGALVLPGSLNGLLHFGPIPWPPTNPVSPPVINPGGPILISCIVGTGCVTRRY